MITQVFWVPKRDSREEEIAGLRGNGFVPGYIYPEGVRDNAEDELRMDDITGGLEGLRLDDLQHNEQGDDADVLADLDVKNMDSRIVCISENLLEIYSLKHSDDGKTHPHFHREHSFTNFIYCGAWLDCPLKGDGKGNFIAVGLQRPGIEIWDIDSIDAMEPCCVLSGHTESVFGIAWNKEFRNIIASACEKGQVKIWDVAVGKCNITLDHHQGVVNALAWNHHAPHLLLCGSRHRSIVMNDGRLPSHFGYKWSVEARVESLAWNPYSEHCFVVSQGDGTVTGFDIRAAASSTGAKARSSFTVHAHDRSTKTVSYNSLVPNLLATGSINEEVKIWDLTNDQPSRLVTHGTKDGSCYYAGVFSISFSEDNPFTLAIGGTNGRLELWDIMSERVISRRYGHYNNYSSF